MYTEYLTTNTEIAYPFVDDAAGISRGAITHGGSATIPVSAVADAVVVASRTSTKAYLSEIDGGSAPIYTFRFRDQDGNVVASGTVDIAVFSGTDRYVVAVFTNVGGDNYVKLVLYAETCLTWLPGITGVDSYGTSLQLLDAVVEADAIDVRSLQLYGDGILQPPTSPVITGRVGIECGYNIDAELDVAETEGDTTTLTLAAVSGRGQGRTPCEVQPRDPQPVKLPIQADSAGNVNIEADDCHDVIAHPDLGMFVIHGVCQPCCTCEDYVNVLEALRVLFQKAKCAHCYLRDAHDGPTVLTAESCVSPYTDPCLPLSVTDRSYTYGVTYFNTVIASKRYRPVLVVNGMRGAGYQGSGDERTGSCNYATFTASIRNSYKDDIRIAAVPNDFSYTVTPTPAGAITELQVAWEHSGSGANVEPPPTTLVIPRGTQVQVFIYVKAPFNAAAPVSFHIDVDVRLEVVATPAIFWDLHAEADVQ